MEVTQKKLHEERDKVATLKEEKWTWKTNHEESPMDHDKLHATMNSIKNTI
jgi:hypothetical protein